MADEEKEKKPEEKKPEEKPDDAVKAAIEKLKKRAEAAEKRAADLEKKNAEQEEALQALMGDGDDKPNANAGKFWSGLRYIKRKGG